MHPVAAGARRRAGGERIVHGRRAPAAGRPGALSLHHLALIYLGVHVLDNMDLTAVSEAAAERNRWEFAVTIAPLIVRGGTGAAVSPIATFQL